MQKRKIENHYRHIYWQIQRLYRIRNEIAHAALREQVSLIVYLEHLYHYLSTYISEDCYLFIRKKAGNNGGSIVFDQRQL